MKKRVITILITIILVLNSLPIAYSMDKDSANVISIKYATVQSNSCSLSISGISASLNASLTAKQSTNLNIDMELQKLLNGSYSTIKTWSASRTGTTLSLNETKVINVFSTYRLKVTFKAGNETIVSYAYP